MKKLKNILPLIPIPLSHFFEDGVTSNLSILVTQDEYYWAVRPKLTNQIQRSPWKVFIVAGTFSFSVYTLQTEIIKKYERGKMLSRINVPIKIYFDNISLDTSG